MLALKPIALTATCIHVLLQARPLQVIEDVECYLSCPINTSYYSPPLSIHAMFITCCEAWYQLVQAKVSVPSFVRSHTRESTSIN